MDNDIDLLTPLPAQKHVWWIWKVSCTFKIGICQNKSYSNACWRYFSSLFTHYQFPVEITFLSEKNLFLCLQLHCSVSLSAKQVTLRNHSAHSSEVPSSPGRLPPLYTATVHNFPIITGTQRPQKPTKHLESKCILQLQCHQEPSNQDLAAT